jgi:hypothetical protein
MKQYSLVNLLVVKMKIILTPGLLLPAEKDKRMRPRCRIELPTDAVSDTTEDE